MMLLQMSHRHIHQAESFIEDFFSVLFSLFNKNLRHLKAPIKSQNNFQLYKNCVF